MPFRCIDNSVKEDKSNFITILKQDKSQEGDIITTTDPHTNNRESRDPN